MQSPDGLWLVVPAAGVGSRLGAAEPKQYVEIAGKTILEHTLEALVRALPIRQIALCIGADDLRAASVLKHNPILAPLVECQKLVFVIGGASRAHSVLNGLRSLRDVAADQDWVLVHDAARPCVSESDLTNLVGSLVDEAVGGILAVPAHDTLKQVFDNNEIDDTLPRSQVWHAQTPQMFRYQVLVSALEQAQLSGLEITDESSAVEHMGLKPKVIAANDPNPKITTRNDLDMATFLLSKLSSRQ